MSRKVRFKKELGKHWEFQEAVFSAQWCSLPFLSLAQKEEYTQPFNQYKQAMHQHMQKTEFDLKVWKRHSQVSDKNTKKFHFADMHFYTYMSNDVSIQTTLIYSDRQ